MTVHETCGCCEGAEDRTPAPVFNRPGLAEIAYRVGTYGDFNSSLIAGLTDTDRAELASLTTRDSDDLTIALLDSWSVVADVLTFYTERLANESYLRTSKDRTSLQELGKLIGYQLRPGAAAETHLTFAIEAAPAAPTAASKDPGSAPPVTPAKVTLEKGLRVQSIPGPGEKPQTFETVEQIEAKPEWNAISASTSMTSLPIKGDTSTWLEGSALNLQAGDVLLLSGPQIIQDRWDVRVLTNVDVDSDNNRTKVSWKIGLGSTQPPKDPAATPKPYVLRKRINVFGHNAPSWSAMSSDFKKGYKSGHTGSKWPGWRITDGTATDRVDLDGSHPDVVADSWVVLSRPGYRELFQVDEVEELARAEFAMSGKVTRLTLKGGEHWNFFEDDVRETTVYAVSEPLELADTPDTRSVGGDEIEVDQKVADMPQGRVVIVVGTTTSGVKKAEKAVVSNTKQASGRWILQLEKDLQNDYKRDTVVVHANVALATHGETVTEVLGSGSAIKPFQTFGLSHKPLTFVQSSDPSGIETTLQVQVNDVRWTEASTLYEAASDDHSYVVRTNAAGKRFVQFGDGTRGARLPTGSQNVRSTYRKGIGVAGNVDADSLAQPLDRPLGLKGVSNPAAASGGVDPETTEAARESMPLNVRTLGRAVSLLDYEDFARAFTGVAKASATVLPLRAGPTIVVTVALLPGTTTDPTTRLKDLAEALRTYGDPLVQVTIEEYKRIDFRLALRVGVSEGYGTKKVLAAVENSLRSAYQFSRRRLSEPVWQSEIVGVAHGVRGVASAHINRLYVGSTPGLADRLVPPQPAVAADGTAIPAGLLALNTGPLDWLEEMT